MDIDQMETPTDTTKTQITRLSIVFALIYFFSTNGLASLPGLTISFLLKDVLHMTASQAAYFGAITLIGWMVKPLWGIISDAFPLFGYRRKSYLIVTTIASAAIWFTLGQIKQYDITTLIILFTLSSAAYAFMDVLCDALMVENGKAHGLTGRFQSIQWTAVYMASVITGIAGGWVAQHLAPQTVFSINGIFPIMILLTTLVFINEEKQPDTKEQYRQSMHALKEAFGRRETWILAFFLFFWTFSPSFGTPFFYYAVDELHFTKLFFGVAATLSAVSSALGALLYGRYHGTFKPRNLINGIIGIGVATTLFDLIYFTPLVTHDLSIARMIFLTSAAILGAIGAFAFLTMANAAALASPRYSEGTTFAVLTSFWNIGQAGSSVLGGFLFDKIGLQPLIIVSAIFTAATWFILPYMKFQNEE